MLVTSNTRLSRKVNSHYGVQHIVEKIKVSKLSCLLKCWRGKNFAYDTGNSFWQHKLSYSISQMGRKLLCVSTSFSEPMIFSWEVCSVTLFGRFLGYIKINSNSKKLLKHYIMLTVVNISTACLISLKLGS